MVFIHFARSGNQNPSNSLACASCLYENRNFKTRWTYTTRLLPGECDNLRCSDRHDDLLRLTGRLSAQRSEERRVRAAEGPLFWRPVFGAACVGCSYDRAAEVFQAQHETPDAGRAFSGKNLLNAALSAANSVLRTAAFSTAHVAWLLVGFNPAKLFFQAGSDLAEPSDGVTQFFVWPKSDFKHSRSFISGKK